jgi:hypothetical protein
VRRWDGRSILVAVCLGLSLGMSVYSVYRTLVPASPPALTLVAVPAPVQVMPVHVVPEQAVPEQAVPTLIPFDRVGTTMYDEPPVGPKPLVFH